jgi:hypothetical protein
MFRWESPKERDHPEDQGVGGMMGSEWILGRLAWGCELDSTGSGQGPVASCCECSDVPSGSCATELVSFFEERTECWNVIGNNFGFIGLILQPCSLFFL